MYMLVKFLRELSIVRNFQDYYDIVWWVHYSRLYDSVTKGYFRWYPISIYGNFSLHFPTMASAKAKATYSTGLGVLRCAAD